ncbi:glycosyltransferase family 4 protein [Clostridium ganghwense]|uniref:Glycosyltransferase family 4 protein n=1 Tax=Clostridium ganghwense TaxID=312089 RepID=A0ABT4CTY3_9CLOT|nr:glycosyltransferase family 4 protein [Clostridium ganghwense]MCY6371893.1 glycosyltransferase family 4 protein [Clostridium ganghwense]
MRILMLSWEYPPKNVGGLSNHVYYLSHSLANKGHEVHVITCEEGTAPIKENDNGVLIHRVSPYNLETQDFTKWIMQLNFAMIEEGIRLINDKGEMDIIHAHDWLTTYAAKTLKWAFNIPVVSTIHATEYGRNNGIKTDMQRYISSVEWMLTYESWKVVACSNYMREQIKNVFSTPWEKIWVIPNGVEANEFQLDFDTLQFRRKFAKDDEKIVFYVGRHVFEKGIHILINAASQIIKKHNKTKFIIAGTGPMTDELKKKVRDIGLSDKVLFTGYMEDNSKNKLYKVADMAIFPSLYEPFGIVALEGMAAGCPIVVSDVGGFSEIVEHKVNGMKFIPGSVESLKKNVLELLSNEELSKKLKENAYRYIREKYSWDKIACLTVQMYEQVKNEAKETEWEVEKKQ